ncbi:hypothetical protein C8J37_11212 [Rhizobium sp. PP-WC-1G-195]|nr:hypothetical protein C8J37_11212 [Rhizobium sp. PP-WC-1G-195]
MRSTLSGLPEVVDTKFEYSSSVVAQIADRSLSGSGLGIYLTLFSEGGQTGTVQNGGGRVGRTRPPTGTEFLKTGIHLVIDGNHLAYVANGQTNDGQITALVTRFLKAKGAADPDTQFGFMARSNRRELERLLRQGVKSIDLGITSFLAAAQELSAANVSNHHAQARQSLLSLVSNLFGRDRTPEQIEAASEIQASLHIGYDGRGASDLVPQLLTSVASQVSDGSDDFKIVTKSDVVITRDKLIIKRDVNVEGDEISLDPQSTFQTLRECLRDWRRDGIMDE